jgi:glycosyltransferase involved in cell wall biosynthesis
VAKPRVLIFQTHAENSGTQEISRMLNAGLSARGYEVFELISVSTTAHMHAGDNVVVCSMKPGKGIAYHVRMALQVLVQFRRLRPDVVLSMQWGGNMLSAFIAPFAGSPVLIANQFTAPTVPPLARWIDRVQGASGSFARIVANSRAIERLFANHPARYRKRLVLIDHGFQPKTSRLSKADARRVLGLPPNGALLGSVGRLSTGKHLDAAVKLLPGQKGWRLALCGHGPEEERLRALAHDLGCADRLHLLGEVHPDRVGDVLAAFDVFVFPTIAETFGLAAVEAAQAGVPVVANTLPVLQEVLSVKGEPCALFVSPDDTGAFAEAVTRALSDEPLRDHLRSLGGHLEDNYPLEKMFDAYDELIQDVVTREGKRNQRAVRTSA